MSLLEKHRLNKTPPRHELDKLEKENSNLRDALVLVGEYIEYISTFSYAMRPSDYQRISKKSEEVALKIKPLLNL